MKNHKIAVLIKQVIDTRRAEQYSLGENGTVDRNALPAIINPEDLNALEQALELKEQLGNAEIVAISMGPQRAAEALKEAIYRGADSAVLVSDRRVAGADTLATSYALSLAVRKAGADIVLAGRQTIDGDTAHVGPQTAQALGIPQITYAEDIYAVGENKIRVKRRLDNGYEVVETPLPVLVTVGGTAAKCRPCNVKRLLKYRKAEVTVWSADDLNGDVTRFGLSGSPTQVIKSEQIVNEAKGSVMLTSSTEDIAALVGKLIANHSIE